MKNAIIYTVIFAAIQIVVSFGVQGAYMLIYGPGARIDAMGKSGQRCRVTGCAPVRGQYFSGV